MLLLCGLAAPALGSTPTGFSLKFNDEVCPYHVMATFLMPEEELRLEAQGTGEFGILASAGEAVALGESRWRWKAPKQPGLYPIVVTDHAGAHSITLNVFVMVPYDGSEKLKGYPIGRYQAKPLRGDPAYAVPRGFVEVTEENAETPVSPHFKLRQFLCKQSGGWPRYLLLRERLLLQLEKLLQELRSSGIPAETLHVMSGFRTPHYNKAIGNTTKYSRHCYGDAADVFVDTDGDGVMDDLNQDGRVDSEDARFVYHIVDQRLPYDGGLGLYKATHAHGPDVHVDVRGFRTRW